MSDERKTRPQRHYPGIYERVVPIALVLIAIAILILLLIVAAVALGLFPGG